jgi:hypothetical protein
VSGIVKQYRITHRLPRHNVALWGERLDKSAAPGRGERPRQPGAHQRQDQQLQRGLDAAAWRPPKVGQCSYATRYVIIKARYRLGVDSSEKTALRQMLATCTTHR